MIRSPRALREQWYYVPKTLWDRDWRNKFYIAYSEKEVKGLSLYAKKNLEADTIIAEYKGDRIPTVETRTLTRRSDFIVQDSTGSFAIDGYNHDRQQVTCAAGYINDPLDTDMANVKFLTKNKRIYICTLRPISKDEEILINYGHEYWCHPRWPLEILIQAREGYARDIRGLSNDAWDRIIADKRGSTNEQQGNTPTDTGLRLSTWNTNGNPASFRSKLKAIIRHFNKQQLDILLLQDVRLTCTQARFFAQTVEDAIQGSRVCLFLNKTYKVTNRDPLMGGTAAIVSERWKRRLASTKADFTGLGLVGRLEFKTSPTQTLVIISVYLPPKPSTPGSCTLWSKLTTIGKATRNTKPVAPYDLLCNIITKWVTKARARGHTVIIAGDFNGSMETHTTNRDIRPLAGKLQLSAPLITQLLQRQAFHTFHRLDKGISRIDHILHTPLPQHMRITDTGCLNSPTLIAAAFDHRPVWVGFNITVTQDISSPESHLKIPPRLNINPRDPEEVKAYTAKLLMLHAQLPPIDKNLSPTLDPETAATRLAAIHHITLQATLTAKGPRYSRRTRLHDRCQRIRSHFKDGFSPEMRVIQEGMVMVIKIVQKMFNSAGYKRHGWRGSPLRNPIHALITAWQERGNSYLQNSTGPAKGIADINFRNDYRSADPRAILSWTAKQVTKKNLLHIVIRMRGLLHGRDRTEMRKRLTDRTNHMEALLEQRRLQAVLQKIGLKIKTPLRLTTVRTTDGTLLTTPQDIHEGINKHFRDHHAEPAGLDPVAQRLQDDPNWWKTLLDPQSVTSQEPLHPCSNIPLTLQHGLRRALCTKVKPEMADLLGKALEKDITHEEFYSTLHSISFNRAPGPSMVSSNMVKSWPPAIQQEAFTLIKSLWKHKHVPTWWRDRVMTPILKKPGEPSFSNLRPIGLLEISRKILTRIISHRILTVCGRNSRSYTRPNMDIAGEMAQTRPF